MKAVKSRLLCAVAGAAMIVVRTCDAFRPDAFRSDPRPLVARDGFPATALPLPAATALTFLPARPRAGVSTFGATLREDFVAGGTWCTAAWRIAAEAKGGNAKARNIVVESRRFTSSLYDVRERKRSVRYPDEPCLVTSSAKTARHFTAHTQSSLPLPPHRRTLVTLHACD